MQDPSRDEDKSFQLSLQYAGKSCRIAFPVGILLTDTIGDGSCDGILREESGSVLDSRRLTAGSAGACIQDMRVSRKLRVVVTFSRGNAQLGRGT